MGTDWSSYVDVGIPVTEADFFTTETDIRIFCAHSAAVGHPFCPECGRAEGDRKVSVVPGLILGHWS